MKNEAAFTLIELLVVIAIIGILATTIYLSINPAETIKRSKIARLVSEFTQLEQAFLMCYMDENRSDWWTEDELDLGGNPTLKKIIRIENGPLSCFSEYIPNEKITDVLTDGHYRYDHDSNDEVECDGGSSNWSKGANIAVYGLSLKEKKEIEKMIGETEDNKCGKITYGDYDGGSLYWRISPK